MINDIIANFNRRIFGAAKTSAIDKLNRCSNDFDASQAITRPLLLELESLNNKHGEISRRLLAALDQGNDVKPILQEMGDVFLKHDKTLLELSRHYKEAAAACRRSAFVLKSFPY